MYSRDRSVFFAGWPFSELTPTLVWVVTLSSSLSCIQGCKSFALNSTVNTINYKAYHLFPVPHKPSVPVSLLPPLCVWVCVRVCARGARTHTRSVCTYACMTEERTLFPVGWVIFRIYLHTLLVHNWHPSLSCLMHYHYINLLTK